MAKYAEIIAGKVHQVWEDVYDEDFSPPISAGAELVEFPDERDVRPGMLWDGTTLSAPPPESLDSVKARAKEAVKTTADAYGDRLTGQYPENEMRSWAPKAEAARAYVAGSATPAQKTIIETEATYINMPPMDLANAIIAKSDFFTEVAAVMAGLRGKAYALIDAAQSAVEVEQILQQMAVEAQQAWDDLMSRAP